VRVVPGERAMQIEMRHVIPHRHRVRHPQCHRHPGLTTLRVVALFAD
jgi:hypothetical protein